MKSVYGTLCVLVCIHVGLSFASQTTVAIAHTPAPSEITTVVKQVIDHVKQHKDSYGTVMTTCACIYFFYRLHSAMSKTFKNKLNTELAQLFSTGNRNYADIETLTQTIITLINKGADVNTTNTQGDPLLVWAARNGHTALARIALDRKAHVNARGQEETTALILAAGGNRLDILKMLLQQEGIDVDLQDAKGATALIEAAQALSNNAALMALLLQAGAPIDTQDREGYTALMYICMNGLRDCAELLLNDKRQYPTLSLTNISGLTARQIAYDAQHSEIVELLSTHAHNRIESNPFNISNRTESNSIDNSYIS